MVRFETGSSSEAVLASHTVASANGQGAIPSRLASASTTGVSSTAVVSSDSRTVVVVPRTTTSSHSRSTEPRPPREASAAADSNTPAASASSATTVIPSRNTRIGVTLAIDTHSQVCSTTAAQSSATTMSSWCWRPALRAGAGVGSAT